MQRTITFLLSFLFLGCAAQDSSQPPLDDCSRCDEDSESGSAFLSVTQADDGRILVQVDETLGVPDYLTAYAFAGFNFDDPSKVDVGLLFFRTEDASLEGIKGIPKLTTTRDWDPNGIKLDMPFEISTISLRAKGDKPLPLTFSYKVWAHDYTANDGFESRGVDDEWVIVYHAYAIEAPAGELKTYSILRPATGDDILVSLNQEGSLDWRALTHGNSYEIGYDADRDEISVERLDE